MTGLKIIDGTPTEISKYLEERKNMNNEKMTLQDLEDEVIALIKPQHNLLRENIIFLFSKYKRSQKHD